MIRGTASRFRPTLVAAVAMLAAGAIAKPVPAAEEARLWNLECDTSPIPVGSDEWAWTRMSGLEPLTDDGRLVAAIDGEASLLVLLRDSDGGGRLSIQARGGPAVRFLEAELNGVDLGRQKLRRRWRTVDFEIPSGVRRRGPNVVRLFAVPALKAPAHSEPALLAGLSVEPAKSCSPRTASAVSLSGELSLPPQATIVTAHAWRRPSDLDLGIATSWPATSLSAYCFDRRSAHEVTTASGGMSRRLTRRVRLEGACASGDGLVLLANGPGRLDLRWADLRARGLPWRKILGVPLVLGLAILAAVVWAAARSLGRGSSAAAAAVRKAAGLVQRAVTSPLVWLLVVFWLVFFSALDGDGLSARRVNDTKDYEELVSKTAVSGLLAHHRTVGYPLFLRLAGWESSGIQKAPIAHALFYGASVLVFFLGVRVYAGSGWLAFFAALPLAWSPLLRIIRRVQPDFLGGATALMVLGLLLLLAARNRRAVLLWTALAAVGFASYQIRPGNVFLIGFVPMAAVILWAARHGVRDRAWRRFATASVIAGLGPFLLFGALRWITVGHFGLVSYGGFQVIGITAPMLDEDLVAEVPEHLRPLAAGILEEMNRQGMPLYTSGSPLEAWFRRYANLVWGVSVPVARRIYEPDGPHPLGLIEINDRFTELSFAIIARRPVLYADWVVRCFGAASLTALREPWVRWPLVAAAVAIAVLLVRRTSPADLAERSAPLAALLLAAVLYYTIHILLVVAVEETLERYYVATMFFLPSALCALAADLVRQAWGALGAPLRGG